MYSHRGTSTDREMYSRREVFTALAAGSVAVGNLFGQQSAATAEGSKPFTLPSLPYPADALEPHIDAQTMQIHHGKHHAAYVNNLNNALAAHPDLAKKPVDEILKNLNAVPEAVRTVVRNNGGGHSNHSLFWKMLSKQGGKPSGELAKAIDKKFGSLQSFQDQFTKAAVGQFGSGWAWLAMNSQKELQIVGTPNQDTPVMTGSTPLLGLDVWEHAYYLKYQNRRPEYVAAFWNVVNWNFVNERFQQL